MRHAIVLLLFLSLSLSFAQSTQAPFKEAQKVYTKSVHTLGGHTAIYTSKGWLIYSLKALKHPNIIDKNEALGLYLIEDTHKASPIKIVDKSPKNVARITANKAEPFHIIKEQNALFELAQTTLSLKHADIVMGACATLRGIGTSWGMITSHYILDFLNNNDSYATAGINTKAHKKGIEVVHVNVFFAYSPFKVGDIITHINGKPISQESFLYTLAHAKVGEKLRVNLVRNDTKKSVTVYLKPMLGGGVLAHTYLEHFGVLFDETLLVHTVKHESFADEIGLKSGDRLIQIDDNDVKNGYDVREVLSNSRKYRTFKLLFERNGLQFALYIPKDYLLKVRL